MSELNVLRTALAWAIAVPATAVFALAAVAAAAIPGRSNRALAVARLWARFCLMASGCRLRVEGLDRLEPVGPCVVMANHQSALDIPAVLAALPARLELSFWAKDSLFRVPFLGWAMRSLGYISIDRVNRRSAAGMFASSLEQVARGRSLLVFPEETYGRQGRLLSFQRGGFLIALRSRVPIVPVGVGGTDLVLPPGRRRLRPGAVTVRIGEPVRTEDLAVSERVALGERVRRVISELSGRSAE